MPAQLRDDASRQQEQPEFEFGSRNQKGQPSQLFLFLLTPKTPGITTNYEIPFRHSGRFLAGIQFFEFLDPGQKHAGVTAQGGFYEEV
jgi:hypothetical protein